MARTSSSNSGSTVTALPALPILWQRPQTNKGAELVSVEDFCKIKATEQTGVHIYYLPSVQHKLRSDWELGDREQNPVGSDDLRQYLTREYHLPTWFWEKQGWDANGFFGSEEDPITDLGQEGSSHCSFSRFLVKEVEDQIAPVPPNYHWRYLAFTTLWFKKKPDDTATLIVLCFDIIEDPVLPGGSLHNVFEDQLSSLDVDKALQCPYSVYTTLIRVIVSQYNRAGWTFRKPVRAVENKNEPKERGVLVPLRRNTNMSLADHRVNKTRQQENYEKIETDRDTKVQDYRHMHGLSRHIIHASETLSVAIRTVSDLAQDTETCWRSCCSKDGQPRARKVLQYTRYFRTQASFLQNLNERNNSFYKRLQNEMKLAFHLVDADDTSYTRLILDETKHDGREFTNVVSILSLVFLPPTFTAGLFGMNFPFGFESLKPMWIWVTLTAVLWVAAYLAYLYSKRHSPEGRDSEDSRRSSSSEA